jgi:Fe-S-cluster containining protein
MFQEQLKAAFETERDLVAAQCGRDADFSSINAATINFYKRLDETIMGASIHVEQGVQCKKGCAYCCHFRVDVNASEVFAISEYIKTVIEHEKFERYLEKAGEARETLAMMSQAKRIKTNVACPLLIDNACSVYELRPAMCRKIHSTNVEACKQSYDNPEDGGIENAEHPVLAAITMTMLTAARDGFTSQKLDATVYDLGEVLVLALEDTKYRKRWLNGKKAFP